MDTLTKKIHDTIAKEVRSLPYSHYFRSPILAVSDANDPRYEALPALIGEWIRLPHVWMPEVKSVVSYFIPYSEEVAASPDKGEEGLEMWGRGYALLNDAFLPIAEAVSKTLAEEGYRAITFTGSDMYDGVNLRSPWSHRHAAVISGLGTFGHNRMLITNKGCSGRIGTILTDAPLAIYHETLKAFCLHGEEGNCNLCQEACPVSAHKGETFDKFVCDGEVLQVNAEKLRHIGACDVCGKCVSNCPLSYIR